MRNQILFYTLTRAVIVLFSLFSLLILLFGNSKVTINDEINLMNLKKKWLGYRRIVIMARFSVINSIYLRRK